MAISKNDIPAFSSGSQFGSLLKRFRVAANMSQIELADRSGLSRNGLSDLERGARSFPRQETIALIAEALKLTTKQRLALAEAAKRNRGSGEHQANLRDIEPALSMLPLVGRGETQKQIDDFFNSGKRSLLAISGETGIGKSRILFETAQSALAAGWQLLSARCHRWSSSEAFGPFVDLLENDLSTRKDGFHAQVLADFPLLDRLVPLKGAIPAPDSGDAFLQKGDLARRTLFSAVADYCARIAGPSGTLLLLDDMHWAGDDAIQLIQFLLRSESNPPIAVAIAYRTGDEEASQTLKDLVSDSERQGICQSVSLSGLEKGDSLELYRATIEESLPGEEETRTAPRNMPKADLEKDGATIQGLTGGIPYYIISYAQSIISGDGPAGHASMMECLKQRLASLNACARDVLGVLAVNGAALRHTLMQVALSTLGHSENTAIAALDDLFSRELLRDDGQANYSFVQELMREIVFVSLSPARRIQFHKVIAESLESSQPFTVVEKLAFHYEAAQVREKAAHYLELAAKHALSLFSNRDAKEYFQRALAIRTETGPDEKQAHIRSELVTVLMVLGEYDEALAHIETALARLRSLRKIPEQAPFYTRLMQCLIRQGKIEDALARGESFGHLGSDFPPSEDLADFLTGLAYAYYVNHDFAKQLATIEHAESMAQHIESPTTKLLVYEGKALALVVQSRYRENADMVIRKVLPTAQAVGDTHKFAVASLNLGSTLMMLGSYEENRDILDKAAPVVNDLKDGRIEGFAAMLRLDLDYETGNWQNAVEFGNRVLKNRSETLGFVSDITLQTARLDYLQGREGAAISKFNSAKELGPSIGSYELLPVILLSEVDLHRGNAAQAAERLKVLEQEPWNNHPGMFDWDALRACAIALSEGSDAALSKADESVRGAREAGLHPSLSDTLRYRGWIHLSGGNIEAATVDLEEALAIETILKRPYNRAKILTLASRVSSALENHEEAARRLDEAEALCAALGERVCLPHIQKLRQKPGQSLLTTQV